ncbi:hypothetical protein DFP72DRAFT_856346 [Ephemerocybe angulata]|uniref:Uncharacterized protein n=1 Tax=Ephemerocybe angulata TaxID=980116 RepID=A0A8H6LYA3_9AGAR|nr:hypothetical protein DFP72DRAFT_856346 [Tulosesus angulatus]
MPLEDSICEIEDLAGASQFLRSREDVREMRHWTHKRRGGERNELPGVVGREVDAVGADGKCVQRRWTRGRRVRGRRRVSGVVGSEEELPGVVRREGDVAGADGKRPASLDVMETRWRRVGGVQRCWARKQPGGGRNKAPGAAERKGDAAGGDTNCPASLGARKTRLGGETKRPAPWDAKETWWCQMRSLWDMWT